MLTPERDARIAAFLADAGWGAAARGPMGADWSARRYERLRAADGRTRILMDAPGPAAAQVPPFVRICGILRGCGLSAPVTEAGDDADGLLLLEDLGDDSFARLLERGDDPRPLYTLATDVLVALHRRFDPATAAGLPRYDADLFTRQVMLFADAYLPAATGAAPTAAARGALEAAWRAVLPAAFAVPDSLLLRDYHPGNLMLLPGRPGVRACGLLDVQDAGLGPVSYDLLSLLEDARRDVPAEIAAAMRARYRDAFPEIDADAFAAADAVLGAVRHARILGRVAELAAGRPARQLDFLPRVWGQLAAKLRHPAVAPVAAWMRDSLPADGAVDLILRGDAA